MPTSTAKPGDTVAVHYTGKLDDGSVFDSSRGQNPIQFVLGARRVISGFDEAVTGMAPGQTKTTTIPATDAYGPRRPELVMEFSRDRIPPNVNAEVGEELQVKTTTGESIPAVIVDASDNAITLDANHPLAGKDLTFEIELVDLVAN